MERMGHDSARAALIYLHSSADRQRALASEVGKNARTALGKPGRSGTQPGANRMSASNISAAWPLTWASIRAPGRTRTCDRLLRSSPGLDAVATSEHPGCAGAS
jgi:hypothetical protein